MEQSLELINILQVLEKLEQLEELESEEEKEELESEEETSNLRLLDPHFQEEARMVAADTIFNSAHNSEGGCENFGKIPNEQFEELLRLVAPQIKKQNTNMRYSIPADIRLALTLRFISTGESFTSLANLSRISRKTIALFVPEVLNAIYKVLQPLYMKLPKTKKEWLDIADDFEKIWQFPHVLGAIDGKHIRIITPTRSNFRGFLSIVLFAMVDAHSRFTYIHVGASGKPSDTTIFYNSFLYRSLHEDTLDIPKPSSETGDIPFFFIGDDTFALDKNIMKPFNRNVTLSISQEIFNYRLCRARMSVEMAFEKLFSRFKIFNRPIKAAPANFDLIVRACCVLHNYLSNERTTPAKPYELVEYSFPEHITPIASQYYSTNLRLGSKIREKLSSYCINEGDVPFQWTNITRS